MDSRYLRAFVAVAETGGISAPAERLGYAQSSLSTQLRRLEDDLGVPVLARTSTGTALTDAGRRLLPHAVQSLGLLFVYDNGVPATGPHEIVDEDRVVLVAAPEHPLAHVAPLDPAALMTAELLIVDPSARPRC